MKSIKLKQLAVTQEITLICVPDMDMVELTRMLRIALNNAALKFTEDNRSVMLIDRTVKITEYPVEINHGTL